MKALFVVRLEQGASDARHDPDGNTAPTIAAVMKEQLNFLRIGWARSTDSGTSLERRNIVKAFYPLGAALLAASVVPSAHADETILPDAVVSQLSSGKTSSVTTSTSGSIRRAFLTGWVSHVCRASAYAQKGNIHTVSALNTDGSVTSVAVNGVSQSSAQAQLLAACQKPPRSYSIHVIDATTGAWDQLNF